MPEKKEDDTVMNEDVRAATAALASFIHAFARLIARELYHQQRTEAPRRPDAGLPVKQPQKLLSVRERSGVLTGQGRPYL